MVVLANPDGAAKYLTLNGDGTYSEAHENLRGLIEDWEKPLSRAHRSLQDIKPLMMAERIARDIEFLLQKPTTLLFEEIASSAEEHMIDPALCRIVRSRLYIAPLEKPERLSYLSKRAVESGFVILAGNLEKSFEYQHRIRELSNSWIESCQSYSDDRVIENPEELWRGLAAHGLLSDLVDSASSLSQTTGSLALQGTDWSTDHQRDLKKILTKVNSLLRPVKTHCDESDHSTQNETTKAQPFLANTPPHQQFQNALSETEEIGRLFANGSDQRAFKRTKWLIDSQQGSPEHLTKSLCNIASKARSIYRYAVEGRILRTAVSFANNDSFLLIQWGDYLKRQRDFTNALEILDKAIAIAEGENHRVALSCKADTLAKSQRYDEAISIYSDMDPDFNEVAIQTAIADTLRARRDFDKAYELYEDIYKKWPTAYRAAAGIAEIQRHEGALEIAELIYRDLCNRDSDPDSLVVWKVSLSRILKARGEPDRALTEIEPVCQKYPYNEAAHSIRASAMAMAGKGSEALQLLEGMGHAGPDEWRLAYVESLILCRRGKFTEAIESLKTTASTAVGEFGERAFRLVTAFAMISMGDRENARNELDTIGENTSSYIEYSIALLLKAHRDAQEEQEDVAEPIAQIMCEHGRQLGPVWDAAMKSVQQRDSIAARRDISTLMLAFV